MGLSALETVRVAGAMAHIFRQGRNNPLNRITDIGDNGGRLGISALRVHPEDEDCLEIAALSGEVAELRGLVDTLGWVKGAMHVCPC
jgi:metal-responsive CopG/Arc/MetJ family transcriptional regulator